MKKIVIISALVTLTIVMTLAILFGFNNKNVEADDIDIYRQLPDLPDDMFLVVREVQSGTYPDICDIPERYWKRPEFYPRWEQNKLIFYDNHDYSTWGVDGYGAYPADIGYGVSNVKAGDSMTFCTFFKTGWNMETYQGVMLVPIDNEYWDVKLDPSVMMLTPVFPEFDKDWVRKIEVTITAKKDMPKGIYNMGFIVDSPSASIDREFRNKVLNLAIGDKEYYQQCLRHLDPTRGVTKERCKQLYEGRVNKYVTAGSWGTDRATFNLEVEVI